MSYESEILQKVARQDLNAKGFRVFLYGLNGSTATMVAVDDDGNVQVQVNPLERYRISDMDIPTSGAKYYGYLKEDGSWAIMEETVSGTVTSYRFITGTSNYSTNWTNRSSLSYDTFDAVF